MTAQTSHLNLRWTVRDVDTVLSMARSGRSARSIALWFTKARFPASSAEIERICRDAGVLLKKKRSA